MSSLFRSEFMSLCEVYVQPEVAFEVLSELGEMGCVQFVDLNEKVPPSQKRYMAEVCRCSDVERKFRYLTGEMIKDKIHLEDFVTGYRALHPVEMLTCENIVDKWETDIIVMQENQLDLMSSHVELKEMYYVLQTVGLFMGDSERSETIGPRNMPLSTFMDSALEGGQLAIITGVVRRDRSFPFEQMLWRISRGNIYYRQVNKDVIIIDPKTGQEIRKVAFIAVCQGEMLSSRMHKVCAGFRVNKYPCPKTIDERLEMLANVGEKLIDLEQVLRRTNYHKCKALRVISKQLLPWDIQVRKAKAVYHHLNRFNMDISKKCLIGQCWVPDQDLNRVQECLKQTSEKMGATVTAFMSRMATSEEPPTYHRTNKFTEAFQALIDTYGAASYRELNPGIYSVITFPFIFSLMFGDFGHGTILFIFALWMVLKEKQFLAVRSTNEIWNITFSGRYVILLLGLFSIYAGFVYNDIFSRNMLLGTSYWLNNLNREQLAMGESFELDPKLRSMSPYIFGIDPIWVMTSNKIVFENSIKMKLSIIFGVIHMSIGVFVSLFNHIYFKRYELIFMKFLPEIIFLLCIFGWLVFMIFWKWFQYGPKYSPESKKDPGNAPQILIMFIQMLLLSTEHDKLMFPAQFYIQYSLVGVALLCIPIMLLGPPMYEYTINKKKKALLVSKISSNFRRYQKRSSNDRTFEQEQAEMQALNEKYPTAFGELLLSRVIETIEFVLSTVSHTASYLRLWALSLAHTQLSELLWHMVLSDLALTDFSLFGAVKIFLIFSVWAAFTITILVLMEGLSAFLHTLRLHWVEFMSKFYEGTGWMFAPFSFKAMFAKLDRSEEKESCGFM